MSEKIEVVVLVKAAPVLTSELDESMCVAGIRTDGEHHEWVRLHPVPFRDLSDDESFAKYQKVSVEVIPPQSDRRPESWRPIRGSITPLERYSTANGWAPRRGLVGRLEERSMCELWEVNRNGSGPGIPSLAVVRPASPPRLRVEKRDADQLKKWTRRADAASRTISLFDNPEEPKVKLEVMPWRFKYQYKCSATSCNGHDQTIIDWELVTLWRKVRDTPDWEAKMQQKFEDEMWRHRDTVLFVGNQEQHPSSFLVLGIFWPPHGAAQGVLDI